MRRQLGEGLYAQGQAPGWSSQKTTAYGESGYAAEHQNPWNHSIGFLRNCYTVNVAATSSARQLTAAERQRVRQMAAEVDQKIRGISCPTGATATAAPSASALGVALRCQTNFPDAGRVDCDATARGMPSGAVIEFDWTFDGYRQQGTGGPHLRLNGVRQGSHTVTVVARDRVSGLSSAPDRISFTKEASGAAGGSSGSGGKVLVWGLVLGGLVALVRGLTKASRTGPAAAPVSTAQGNLATPPRVPAKPGTIPPGLPAQVSAGATRPGSLPSAREGLLSTLQSRTNSASGAPPRPVDLPEPVTASSSQTVPGPVTAVGGLGPTGAPPPISRPPPTVLPEPLGNIPPATAQPRQEDKNTLWLEAPSLVRVRGDGRDIQQVPVRAFRRVNGAPVEVPISFSAAAGAGVRVTVIVPDEKKIRARGVANQPVCVVSGTQLGNVGYLAKITFEGTAASGEAVTPARTAVQVVPISAKLELVVWKRGFQYQSHPSTIPLSCNEIAGTVRAPHPHGGADELVAFAHCYARLLLDDKATGSHIDVLTDKQGNFRVKMPQTLVAVYGAETLVYELPGATMLPLCADFAHVMELYDGYVSKLYGKDDADRRRSPLHKMRRRLTDYSTVFFRRMCESPLETDSEESIHDPLHKLLGSIELLGAAVVFVTRYRREFADQDTVIKEQLKLVWGSLLDIATDVIPVADSTVKWMRTGGPMRFLPAVWKFLQETAVAKALVTSWPGRIMLKGLEVSINASLTLFRAAVGMLVELFSTLANVVAKLGIEVGRPLREISKLWDDWRTFGDSIDAEAFGRMFSESASQSGASSSLGSKAVQAVGALFKNAMRAVQTIATCAGTAMVTFISLLSLSLATVVKAFGKLLAGISRTMHVGGGGETWGEVVEAALGDWADHTYNNIFRWGEAKCRNLLALAGAPVAPAAAPAADNKSFMDYITDCAMKPLPQLLDFEERCAAVLNEVQGQCMKLEIPSSWEESRSAAIKAENRITCYWQEEAERQAWGEWAEAWCKLLAKVVQTIAFPFAAFAEGACKVLTRAAAKPERWYAAAELMTQMRIASEGMLKLASKAEMAFDAIALAIRLPVCGVEIAKLYFIDTTAHHRVRGLFNG